MLDIYIGKYVYIFNVYIENQRYSTVAMQELARGSRGSAGC